MANTSRTKTELLSEIRRLRDSESDFRTLAQELAGSERRYRLLAENIADVIVVADLALNVTYVSPSVERLTGYAEEEALRLTPEDVLPLQSREEVFRVLRDALRAAPEGAGRPYRIEVEAVRKDGRHIWVEAQFRILQNAYGAAMAFQGVLRDVTERKQAEESLRGSQSMLAEAQSIAHMGSWEGNLQTGEVVWSDELYRICGVSPATFSPSFESFLELVHPDDQFKVRNLWDSALRDHTPFRVEHRLVRADGHLKYVWQQGRFYGNASGSAARVVGVTLDITDRKRAEQALADEKRQLRRLSAEFNRAEEKERHRIATGLHDDVGQILVACNLMIGRLRRVMSPEDINSTVGEIEKLLDHAIKVIRSLTFELTSSVLYELGLEPALNDLCEKIARQYGLHVEFQPLPEPRSIPDDVGTMLFRTVSELLFNIVKHASATHAVVSVDWLGEGVSITVSDDGQGFQTGRAGHEVTASGGYGLFHVRERIKHLGGDLSVFSAPGNGTKIKVQVPINPETIEDTQ